VGFIKGVACGDYDNDGLPDLYLSDRGGRNVLFHNDGGLRFSDVSQAAGVGESLSSFPTWFFDYDNDGWLDIFVSGFQWSSVGDGCADYLGLPHKAAMPRLYHNRGDGTFADVTTEARLNRLLLAMGSNYGDLDNDGWLDFYLGTGEPDYRGLTPNRAFRNAEGRYFQDVTTSGGFGNIQKGHGVAFGDIDNDGDQDIYETMGGAYQGDTYHAMLFENPGHGNHWITLRLEGVRTNRAAIGARIRVRVETDAGQRDIHVVAGTGGSFGSSSLQQEIGLGSAKSIRFIDVFWPVSAQTQRFEGLPMDRVYKIREGDAQAVPVMVKRFDLAGNE
jgi:ASPIC/UnbV protein/VCBS repeat protein